MERELSDDMLVIADKNKPVAVAGIMGGEYSGIMDDTNTVVFESAYFEPIQVRRTSKKLKLKTDASSRYEKGTLTFAQDLLRSIPSNVISAIICAIFKSQFVDLRSLTIPAKKTAHATYT